MTMDVYAQLEQRAKRTHGTSFDRLVRHAHELHGDPATAAAGEMTSGTFRSPDWRRWSNRRGSEGRQKVPKRYWDPEIVVFSVRVSAAVGRSKFACLRAFPS